MEYWDTEYIISQILKVLVWFFSSRWLLNSTARLSRNHICVDARFSMLNRLQGQAFSAPEAKYKILWFYFVINSLLYFSVQRGALKIGWLILLQVIEDNLCCDIALRISVFSLREIESRMSSSAHLHVLKLTDFHGVRQSEDKSAGIKPLCTKMHLHLMCYSTFAPLRITSWGKLTSV